MTQKLLLAVLGLISLGFANASRGQNLSLAVPAATEHWVLPSDNGGSDTIRFASHQTADVSSSPRRGPEVAAAYSSISDYATEPFDTYLPAPQERIDTTGLRVGADFLLFDRGNEVTFGGHQGLQLSAETENSALGDSTTVQFVGRYLEGMEHVHGRIDQTSVFGQIEGSLLDLQLNRFWETREDNVAYGIGVGLRSMHIRDKLKAREFGGSFSSIGIEASNFALGPQFGMRGRYYFGRSFVGGAANLGVMWNSSEASIVAGGNSASTSYSTFVPFADLDLHAGFRFGEATDLTVGAFILATDSIATSENPLAIAASSGSDVGYAGLRFSISHRF